MTTAISLSISDEAFERWGQIKKALGMNQNDAMSFLLWNTDVEKLAAKKVK